MANQLSGERIDCFTSYLKGCPMKNKVEVIKPNRRAELKRLASTESAHISTAKKLHGSTSPQAASRRSGSLRKSSKKRRASVRNPTVTELIEQLAQKMQREFAREARRLVDEIVREVMR